MIPPPLFGSLSKSGTTNRYRGKFICSFFSRRQFCEGVHGGGYRVFYVCLPLYFLLFNY